MVNSTTAAELRTDNAALMAYLAALAANGARVPCRDVDDSRAAAWTSEDPGTQARAAVSCIGCAGLRACDAYGLAHPREAGVYGGRTETERRTAATATKEIA